MTLMSTGGPIAATLRRRSRRSSPRYNRALSLLLNEDRRKDAEIRGAALQRLMWDPTIPGDYIDAKVQDGWVKLKGEVDHQYQSDEAFDHAASLYGVTGVTNEIKVIEAQ